MKALFAFLFVMTFSLTSLAVDERKPENCKGGDPKCKAVPAGNARTEASVVEEGPTKREAYDNPEACANCIAENPQKNGRTNSGDSMEPSTINDRSK